MSDDACSMKDCDRPATHIMVLHRTGITDRIAICDPHRRWVLLVRDLSRQEVVGRDHRGQPLLNVKKWHPIEFVPISQEAT